MRIALLLSGLLLALGLAACGDEGEGGEIDVTLREWAVEPSVDTLPEGPITFNTKNEGPDHEHELVIIKTDFALEDLPTKDNGSVDEDASGIEVIGEVREIDAGDEGSGSYSLKPGKYVLICNLVDEHDEGDEVHYAEGMYAAFTVTEQE